MPTLTFTRSLIASAPTGEEALAVARLVFDPGMPAELVCLRGEAEQLAPGKWRAVLTYGVPEAQEANP